MKRSLAALSTVLAISVFMPKYAGAQVGQTQTQSADGRARKSGATLGQNYPNPFNPETRIPFGLDGDGFSCQTGQQRRVTIKIYNSLTRFVAIPVLRGGMSAGQPIDNLPLSCGEFEAYWNGVDRNTGREAASGVYLYRLEVDGKTLLTGKMLIAK